MTEIHLDIFKQKLPKDLFYPVRTSDIEKELLQWGVEHICLKIFFHRLQDYDYSKRQKVKRKGNFQIIKLRHPIEYIPIYLSQWDYSPWKNWKELENPLFIGADIYAIPVNAAKDIELYRNVLRKFLQDRILDLTPKVALYENWTLHISLATKEKLLYCITRTWTGLQENKQTKTTLSLEKEETKDKQPKDEADKNT